VINFPINNTMFLHPQYTPESAWLGHIPFAGWLVEEMRPGVLVELGTHRGASYLAFCQAVQGCAVQAKCYAVDTWEGDEHAGVYGDDVFLALLDYHQRNYADFSRLMRMRFEEAVGYFEDGGVDLLHIDGLHTYEAVRNDFETWAPKLSKRAVVLFHDINVRERDFGVWRYWAEISQRYPSFEFTHTHGLGVVLVGEDQPEVLRQLCRFTDVEGAPVLINRLFEHVGQLISTKMDIGTLAREQGRLAGQLNESERARGEISADLTELRQENEALLSRLDEQAAAYRGEVAHSAELSAKVAEVPLLMGRLQAELVQLADALAARDAEAQRIQAEKLQHEMALERMRASFSWRLMAPVRSLKRMFTGAQ